MLYAITSLKEFIFGVKIMKKIFLFLNFINILIILFSSNLNFIKKDNIIAYFPFNGNTIDESGNNYHSRFFRAVLCDDMNKIKESAYEFNGKSNFISTKLNINTSRYPVLTISSFEEKIIAWALPDSPSS